MKKNKMKIFVTEIALCPKYKKKYQMQVVSFAGQTSGAKPVVETAITLLCPACGDYHTITR